MIASSRTLSVVRVVVVLLGVALRAPAARAGVNEGCLGCHSDPSLSTQKGGRVVSLHVDGAVLGRSVHAGLECTDCHANFRADEMPHAPKLRPVRCTQCHADAAKAHPFHPSMKTAAGGAGPSVSCAGCHGGHDVRPVRSPGSSLAPETVSVTCARCHQEAAAQYAESAHGRAAARNVKSAPGCLTCHARPISRSANGRDPATRKIDQEKMCLSCHLDDPEVRARTTPTAGFIAAYESSVHGRALLAGDGAAANCVDCHGAHDMKKGFEPSARVNKTRLPETCGACHREIALEYAGSVHAAALRKGNLDAPACTDCHGEHTILKHADPHSPVAPANVSAQVCTPCHDSVRLSQKYGLPADRVGSFSDSFHGMAIRGGQVEAANCASCHGAHGIRASSDPASSVNRANLSVTCGKCHPGANRRFAIGNVHVVLNQAREPLLFWIAALYVGLIVAVVGGMAAHNGLDFLRKARRRLHERRAGGLHEAAGHRLYLRMTVSERLQHGALLVSFFVLVITGFMLHYPDAWWVAGLRRLSDRLFDLRALLHRGAGLVMVAASLYHLYYLAFTARGRAFLRDIWWSWSDLRDARDVLSYNIGLSSRKPLFGRFSYIEKSEYWALVWGTGVMAATGFVLWFENAFIGWFTKLGWDVARLVHFYEAWLATLAILVWHIYYVIFNPDVYPMNLAWLKGTLSEAEMRDEHPLELAAMEKREADQRRAADADAARRAAEGS